MLLLCSCPTKWADNSGLDGFFLPSLTDVSHITRNKIRILVFNDYAKKG